MGKGKAATQTDIIQNIDTDNIICTDKDKYKTHVLPRLEDIYKWLVEGKTEYSIADSLRISQTTLIKYKRECPEIIAVYRRAQHERNTTVMNAMFAKATGSIATVEQEKVVKGEKVMLKSQIYTPADVNAADLYLRNNDPDYKSAKADTSSLTLNQYNIQLPEVRKRIAAIDAELQALAEAEE